MDAFSNATLEGGRRAGAARLLWPDVARGVAVLAMVAYHLSWDLSALRLITTEITAQPAWRAFAMTIAASFLVLSGVGLALAHPTGLRRGAFARRLAVVAGAALAVTIGTWFAFPQAYVFFGILHAICLSGLLAIPFLRAPAAVTFGAAAALFVAPLLLRQGTFDEPLLAFLGLGTRVPVTNDYVPVAPWSGFVLAGLALARGFPMLIRAPAAVEPTSWATRALTWLGRHSLVIYLAHQPLFFGALSGLVALTGPNPAAVAGPFLRSCVETGHSEAACRATYRCTVDALKAQDLWRAAATNSVTPEQATQVNSVARACYERFR